MGLTSESYRYIVNLSKSQIYECLAYYEDHRGQIDLLVARQTSLILK